MKSGFTRILLAEFSDWIISHWRFLTNGHQSW